MVSPSHLVAFALLSIPLILLPGPAVLFVIGRSLSLGRIGGLLSVLGTSAGTFVAALAISLGIGPLLQESIVLFTVVKLLGAAYLVYLGIQAIRHRRERASAATSTVSRRSRGRILSEGFVVGVSNPKTIVFLIAVLPQFVDYSLGNVPVQMIVLGAIFVGIALASDSVWALAAGAARDWFGRSPRRVEHLSAAGGVMMIGIGTTLAFVGHGDAANP
ncbi:LysE family translocator [Lacisediminihabitans profunda]|uniref:LysE family translocator n=1 Tax=Lacisediminihabitans profunda TaxID=2594790 RepID=A0A5C8URV8_9MICO|nr:LysE family translocator [Lacisediminihabitans profunda]TXN31304.1 LysE family translocator [Lacisediminihabitans profunda]